MNKEIIETLDVALEYLEKNQIEQAKQVLKILKVSVNVSNLIDKQDID